MALLDSVLSGGPPEPVQPLRSFGDHAATRQAIFDNVKSSVEKRFPLENQRYKLHVENVRYDSDKPFSLKQQKQAIMSGGYLDRRLLDLRCKQRSRAARFFDRWLAALSCFGP